MIRSCLKRLRSLVALLPEAEAANRQEKGEEYAPAKKPDAVYELMSLDGQQDRTTRATCSHRIIDADSLDEYKADYGKTLVTAYARIAGHAVGIVASQRLQVRTKKEGIQMGGVIYRR